MWYNEPTNDKQTNGFPSVEPSAFALRYTVKIQQEWKADYF